MADAATKAAVNDAKNALVESLKVAGSNSLKLGIGVTVVALAAQVALIAGAGAFGAGEGLVASLKNTARVTR